ncbi:MAG: hypothetical protein EBU90_12885 [Proteobacteria bacterium]|nr:hypothetical protein [Pseudomonadota bacterium]
MTFKEFFKEAFISPFVSRSMQQTALNVGPDQNMTAGDMLNTFPSGLKKINFKLKSKKTKKKKV